MTINETETLYDINFVSTLSAIDCTTYSLYETDAAHDDLLFITAFDTAEALFEYVRARNLYTLGRELDCYMIDCVKDVTPEGQDEIEEITVATYIY